MTFNSTLCYPTIEIKDSEWVRVAALLWDKIYRIVPDDYQEVSNSRIINEFKAADIISKINPLPYSKEASEEFMKGLNCNNNKWWAAALDGSRYKNEEYIRLHKDKADVN